MLDRLDWRTLQCDRQYAEVMRLMQAARRELGVSWWVFSHPAIARHTGCGTCVHVRKLRQATCVRFRGLHRRIARSDARWALSKYFISNGWMPSSRVQRVRSYGLHYFCSLLRIIFARTVLSYLLYFISSYCTCVNSVKLPVCAFMDVYTEGSQDRTRGK